MIEASSAIVRPSTVGKSALFNPPRRPAPYQSRLCTTIRAGDARSHHRGMHAGRAPFYDYRHRRHRRQWWTSGKNKKKKKISPIIACRRPIIGSLRAHCRCLRRRFAGQAITSPRWIRPRAQACAAKKAHRARSPDHKSDHDNPPRPPDFQRFASGAGADQRGTQPRIAARPDGRARLLAAEEAWK